MTALLRCLNCRNEASAEDAKFFAEVFLCPSCHQQAEHFYVRLNTELVFLQTVAKEAIRVALLEGRFSFPESPDGAPSKREVLKAIVEIEERRGLRTEATRWPTTPVANHPATCSTVSTPQPAPTPAALGSDASHRGSRQG